MTSLAGATEDKDKARRTQINTRITEISTQITRLMAITSPTNISSRKTEYQELMTLSEKFILDSNDVSVSRPIYNISSSFMQL